ncbi:CGNR zinc finger domain-containing protein [Promicromonospora panici]|uniref:CGNR zinc finger domain-containing protein n=1 Tax=Promicromonospora panici TaxID=2219658 RepID=UPI00101C1105|nr:CGNR zinc finger domain-containing protein [Promicromonospora panici]
MQPAGSPDENGFDTWAPPAAAIVRDFVNSYEPQEDAESLDGATALRDWFAARGLAPAGARMTAADVTAARRVREGLRAVLLIHAGHDAEPGTARDPGEDRDKDASRSDGNDAGNGVGRTARRALDAELARIPVRATFDADGGLRLEGTGSQFERGIAGVLDAVRRCEAAGDWERLKVCARDTCRWAFYDASRNHARRWCSMSGCGNYVKMRRRATARNA